ncbi:MAG: InlB B-repeat-containing protein, partial [Paludibacteraceae bacterium]|nr:InlB B-repeat-containing protein [Paludibacteraceae bacterium]
MGTKMCFGTNVSVGNVRVCARVLFLLLFAWLPVKVAASGYTPTWCGWVFNLKPGDRILLSVMVDDDNNPATPDVEYFVCDYPSYTGGHFAYKAGNMLKLIPQGTGATEPSETSVWTVDTALTRVNAKNDGKDYALGGISYTMWSSSNYTLVTSGGDWKYLGALSANRNEKNLCDVIFVVPSNLSGMVTADPNNTLGRGILFNGERGVGFAGMVYREVYMFYMPRAISPNAYVNTSLVCFNTGTAKAKYNGDTDVNPGNVGFTFADSRGNDSPRTLFRLYVLNDQFSSCPDSYFFGYNEQNYKKYRKSQTLTDSTAAKKVYTVERMRCMSRVGDSKYYQTDFMYVPEPDSTYYYVGKQNTYRNAGDALRLDPTGTAISKFKKIRELPIWGLTGFTAPAGACGQMMVDTTSTANNLDVAFKPAGFFLRTNTGRNIRMQPNADSTVWTCEEMWHITAEYAALTIKATMYSGTEYSETDAGKDIPGWSQMVTGTSVPVVGGGSIIDRDGWARIYANHSDPNGALEFVPANPDRHIRYDNNGFDGSQIPDQYPELGQTSVTVENPRLVKGFDFLGWATTPNGIPDPRYAPGNVVSLEEGELTLYAIATYTGTIHVAFSFMQGGERYFLTHPGTASRYASARTASDWTNMWQGMANVDNVEPNYINTFKLVENEACEEGEYLLDPCRELRYGATDSLLFYEHFAPAHDEYLGLYYTDPNALIANNTWAGLFTSTAGWPDYRVADVENTKLKSTHYAQRDGEDNLQRYERSNKTEPYVKYNAATRQFDGVASEAEATTFQVSHVRVADEHYVVIPDTTEEWKDEIVFGYHTGEQTEELVWSKLIGKQLMALMKLDDDTVYFHPNSEKILTTASDLRLSPNYRLVQTFTYIRDARVEALHTVANDDKPHISETFNEFGRLITSGMNTPLDVMYEGEYIDIVDTLRITLGTRGPVKIKEYYGRWKEGADGLHINSDGSRYRDIIIRTKTAHYGEDITKLLLTPEQKSYSFAPLSGASRQINFTLAKVTTRQLLDTDGNVLGEEILTSEDVSDALHLSAGICSFTAGGASFRLDNEQTLNDHISIVTRADNSESVKYDSLAISTNITVGGIAYPVSVRIPLMQTALSNHELIWSVALNGTRYFIMAGSGGFIFRQYDLKGGTLYKKEDGRTQLIKGTADAANSQTQYITPWAYTFVNQAARQITLKTEYEINKSFVINGSSQPDLAGSGSTTLTYELVNEYLNDNANYEQQVKLKYGADKYLKFSVVSETPSLSLTDNSEEATVFSWSYLLQEYNLLNNGLYPNKDQLVFDYNNTTGVSVQTRYKAYRNYSMLLDNTVVYCCREDEADIADLIAADKDWKTNYTIHLISDSRFEEGASGLSKSTDGTTLITTVTPVGDSPTGITYGGQYVNIVDTLDVAIALQTGAPEYRFKDAWSAYSSVNDAHLKIPLVRKTYHQAPFDSIVCIVANDEYNYTFPNTISIGSNDTHEFVLYTEQRTGMVTRDADLHVVSHTSTSRDLTDNMHLDNAAYAEVRLIDEYGNTPSWCHIEGKSANSITIQCTENGIRAPRVAYLYLAYTMQDSNGKWRYINFKFSVSQLSLFQYTNNQTLIHTKGASGDALVNGAQ